MKWFISVTKLRSNSGNECFDDDRFSNTVTFSCNDRKELALVLEETGCLTRVHG